MVRDINLLLQAPDAAAVPVQVANDISAESASNQDLASERTAPVEDNKEAFMGTHPDFQLHIQSGTASPTEIDPELRASAQDLLPELAREL